MLTSEPQIGALEGIEGPKLVQNWDPSQPAQTPMSPKKASKGTVVIQAIKDRLRLRWSYQGCRYTLALQLPDSLTNRKLAEAKARMIERDMAVELFDRSLAKYSLNSSKQEATTVVALFEQFIDYKKKQKLYPQSLLKYEGLLAHLRLYFKLKLLTQVNETEALKFQEWLGKRVAAVTLRERISLLNACWKWALKKKWVFDNPWSEIKVRVPRKQKPKPFTQEEIKRIVEGFKSDRYYCHYADYVEFLLGTGCRLGEAIALR